MISLWLICYKRKPPLEIDIGYKGCFEAPQCLTQFVSKDMQQLQIRISFDGLELERAFYKQKSFDKMQFSGEAYLGD